MVPVVTLFLSLLIQTNAGYVPNTGIIRQFERRRTSTVPFHNVHVNSRCCLCPRKAIVHVNSKRFHHPTGKGSDDAVGKKMFSLLSDPDPLDVTHKGPITKKGHHPLFASLSSDTVFDPSMGGAMGEDEDDDGQEALGIWSARAILLLVAILWGTNFASVKYLETICFHPPCHHLPSEAALGRFGLAALAGLPLVLGKRRDVILGGIECGLLISLGYITQAMALESIPSARCAFICSLTVVVVPFMSALFEGKPVKVVNLISAVLAVGGVCILEGMVDVPGLLSSVTGSSAASHHQVGMAATSSLKTITASANAGGGNEFLGISSGDLIALGQPFGFGLAFMRIEHYVEKFRHVKDRVMTISAAQCLAVGFMSLIWVLHDKGHIPDMTYMLEIHRLGAVLWTGIVTTVFAIYLEGLALQTASATEAAITFASEPVWASLFGAWLLHESLNVNSYVGGAVILGACLIGSLSDLASSSSDKLE